MIERAYADKRFEDPVVIAELSLGKRKANRHAGTLVVNSIEKLIGRVLFVINESLTTLIELN